MAPIGVGRTAEEIADYAERWDPYVVYRVGEMHGRFINVDDGVRRTYTPQHSSQAHRHPVFLFGGSAAWGHGARDFNTLSSWLVRVAAEHGNDLDVRNYAESGWVNWQGIVYLLQKLSEGERPEVVIFYSGVNETLSARRWPQVRRPIWDAELYSSALYDAVLQRTRPLTRTWEHHRDTSLLLSLLLPRPLQIHVGPPTSPDTTIGLVATDYAADKKIVERLGHEFGFSTLFVWQPTVASKSI